MLKKNEERPVGNPRAVLLFVNRQCRDQIFAISVI